MRALSDDAELRLLIAATARPARARHRGVIAAVAEPRAIDWDRFVRLVDRHRVAALVFDALADRRDHVPPAAFGALRARATADRAQALTSLGVLARVTSALADAGIAAVAIKGPVLAQLAFGDVTLRQCHDIDILVPPDALDRAAAALAAVDCETDAAALLADPAGRRAAIRVMKDLTFVHPPSGVTIELHWRFNDNPLLLPVEAVPSRRTIAIGPIAVATLGDDDLLLYLCVHGAKHFWMRLKWLADVHALVANRGAEGIAALYDRGMRLGLGVPVGQSLLLLHRVYGLAIPDSVRRAGARAVRTRMLTRIALRYVGMEREPALSAHYAMMIGHLGFRSEPGYVVRAAAAYFIDVPTLLRMGGTRRGYFAAIVGRPFHFLARRVAEARRRRAERAEERPTS